MNGIANCKEYEFAQRGRRRNIRKIYIFFSICTQIIAKNMCIYKICIFLISNLKIFYCHTSMVKELERFGWSALGL